MMPGLSGRGHRPCHSAMLASGPAGGQSPRPAPDPPTAGASPPPGRALACVVPGLTDLQGTVAHGRGKRGAFPVPARTGEGAATAAMAGAIAPAKALRRDQDQPGAKAPGQRPTRPRRALHARRVGRWPFVVPGPAGLQGTVPRGRGNAGRVSCSRPEGRKQFQRFNGRGHRPCHSAALILDQPGAKAPCQRPTRHRRALRSRRVGHWPAGVTGPAGPEGTVARGRGNAGRVSWSRPH